MAPALKKAALALSGGVDSTTTAALLKEQGFEVLGLFMDLGPDLAPAREAAMRSAAFLDIELHILDLAKEMDQRVIQPWLDGYAQGLTPNPCARCNRELKFQELLARSKRLGVDFLATGHYARIHKSDSGYFIQRGQEPGKEQSYFLARLKKEWLPNLVFPLGGLTKAQVRAKAGDLNLPSAKRPDSQEVCFLAGRNYREFFLERRMARSGEVVHVNGQVLGRHQGLFRHTIGQRRGLNIPWSEPLYVIGLETETNRLMVGPKSALETKTARLLEANWFMDPRQLPDELTVQIRYRAPAHPARVDASDPDNPRLEFIEPVQGLAPGQLGAIYQGDLIIGSGWLATD